MKKTVLAYFLITVLLFSAIAEICYSCIVRASTELDSITKPSVPEFTVKFVDSSYTTHPTYSIDPYTGENVTHHGSYVANKTIEVTIRNQPFVPYYDASSSWNISLYYNVRVKGHYEANWTILYLREDMPYLSENVPSKSASEYTVLSYHSYQPNSENTYIMGGKMMDFPPGSQVDFQVEAFLGYQYSYDNYFYNQQPHMIPIRVNLFIYERSGWSNTQTLTISADALTPSRVEETQRIGLSLFILGLVIAAILVLSSVGLVLYFKKHRH